MKRHASPNALKVLFSAAVCVPDASLDDTSRMIQNAKIFYEWENRWIANDRLMLEQKFRILNGMYEEARSLGVFPPKDPLEGIDHKIYFARALNVRKVA